MIQATLDREEYGMNGARVIIFTKNEQLTQRMRDELAGDGCDVLAPGTTAECMELLQLEERQILVIDLLMPKSVGIELFIACRDHWSWLAIITFTQCFDGEAKVTLGTKGEPAQWHNRQMNPVTVRDHVRQCLNDRSIA